MLYNSKSNLWIDPKTIQQSSSQSNSNFWIKNSTANFKYTLEFWTYFPSRSRLLKHKKGGTLSGQDELDENVISDGDFY